MNPATQDAAAAEEESPVVCTAKKYIFDLHSYAWKESDCLIRIPRPHKGMGHGGMRVCYAVEDVDEEGAGTPMVAKMFRRNISDVVEKDYFNEGAAQCMCEEFANNFNRIHLTNIHKPNISFLQCYVVRIPRDSIPVASQKKRTGFFSYKTQDTGEVMFVMEPMLSGKFTKYNSNYGETYREDKKAALTSSEAKRRTEVFEAAEAFSHFTLVESGGSMLVCDLQGVNDFLTDPQIHTEDGKGLGMGNMGQDGIRKWMEAHVCNEVCRAIMLEPLSKGLRNFTRTAENESRVSYYQILRAKLRSQTPVRPEDIIPLSKPLSLMSDDERLEYAMRLSALLSE